MKYIILFIFSFSYLLFSQDEFLDTIMLDQIERIYPSDDIVSESSYVISMNFDLNRYRLNEPITMEIKIYAKKGKISFTNSINPFNNYKFTVFDNFNNEVISSDNYTSWKYKNERNLNNTENRIVTLNEGESYSYFIDLNNWFYFSKPGRYRIEGSFNPIPDISDKFDMKADTAYFFVDKALENRNDNKIKNNVNPIIKENLPILYPGEVVSNTLQSMKTKNWTNYFNYMHLPSIISISQRYFEAYRNNYSNSYIENFTDLGVSSKIRQLSFENFLKTQFSDEISAEMIRTNFGNNFLQKLEDAYKSRNIRELAIRFDILYRTALPEDRKELFDEFKKYLASAYDAKVRNSFIAELQRNIVSTKDKQLKEHYQSVLSMIQSEYDPAVTYTLLDYKIDKITITEEYGIERAQVETRLFNRYFNSDNGNIYDPTIKRVFILRKIGKYWYIVNYYDAISN